MFTLTKRAAEEIKGLMDRGPGEKVPLLRVRVTGGGCSGLLYKLEFEEDTTESVGKILEIEGINVIFDPKSWSFIQGTTLDFSSGLEGTGFQFQNPNAKRTCGCGSSFSV